MGVRRAERRGLATRPFLPLLLLGVLLIGVATALPARADAVVLQSPDNAAVVSSSQVVLSVVPDGQAHNFWLANSGRPGPTNNIWSIRLPAGQYAVATPPLTNGAGYTWTAQSCGAGCEAISTHRGFTVRLPPTITGPVAGNAGSRNPVMSIAGDPW